MKHRFWDVRTYREPPGSGLVPFTVAVEETDIFFLASSDLSGPALELIKKYRKDIENYILLNPEFLRSLSPVEPSGEPPEIVRQMISFSRRVNVGPMAGVAGAIAEFVGRDLLAQSAEIIAENGGDVFLSVRTEKVARIKSLGGAPSVEIRIKPEDTPMGLCTSSGKFGHSKSFGLADSVTVISKSAILSDCAATAAANMIKSPSDIGVAIDWAKNVEGIAGLIAICGGKMGFWGNIELI